MGFRLIAWEASSGVSAFGTNIAVVADQSMTKIDANTFQVPAQNQLVGIYGAGADLTAVAIVTPSLKIPADAEPVDTTANGSGSTTAYPPFHNLGDTPVQLVSGEGINGQPLTDGTSAALVIGAWLADGNREIVTGKYYHGVRATSSTTLTVNTWTNCSLTFDNSLPAGTYAVVGLQAMSATGILARIVFNDYQPRPGVVAGTVAAVRGDIFRMGNFLSRQRGQYVSWGKFLATSPPTVDFLAGAADTSETVLFDLIQTKGGQ